MLLKLYIRYCHVNLFTLGKLYAVNYGLVASIVANAARWWCVFATSTAVICCCTNEGEEDDDDYHTYPAKQLCYLYYMRTSSLQLRFYHC